MELRIPMQPTMPPPWIGWSSWDGARGELEGYLRRRFRLTLHDLADLRKMHDLRALNIDWSRLPRQEIAVYVPKNLRHLNRFENTGGRATSGLAYPTSGGSWRPERYPIDAGPWRLPDLQTIFDQQHIRLEALPPNDLEVAGSRRWEGTARAWAAGAIVLAVIVLIVRAVEKCLHRKFYKGRRRRQSEEWPTPNVTATQRNPNDQEPTTSRFEDSDSSQSEHHEHNNDLPPPYSECANSPGNTPTDPDKYIGPEEPPPPYSACYVAYSNPKDGIPSVHFCNRQREAMFQPEVGNSSNETEASRPEGQRERGELVFDNGRVIERGNVRARERRHGDHIVTINGQWMLDQSLDMTVPDDNHESHEV